jgi:hypothetical protein
LERQGPGGETQSEPGIDAEGNLLGNRTNQLSGQPAGFGQGDDELPVGQLMGGGALAVE